MVKLSICIPVYNFGAFLGETLDSIRPQCEDSLDAAEVLVLDGASTDNTAAVVGERAAAWPQLKYVRLPKRGGIDADLAESVRLARGEFCWLFSGDDLMRPGSFKRALVWLEEEHDVYICKHSNCDLHMNAFGEQPVLRGDSPQIAELSDPANRLAYLSAGITSEAVFSFLSGLIVKRASWLSVGEPSEFIGSCWAHAARLFAIAQNQLRVCYVAEKWVDRRGDNDSFLENGAVNRLRIAVDGFHGIANKFFGHGSREAAEIRRMVRNDLSLKGWLDAKCRTEESPDIESKATLDRLLAKCYEDPGVDTLFIRAVYRFTPVRAYRWWRQFRALMRGARASRYAREGRKRFRPR